jgi:2',3'-cyclic-nucleotide 2'-phosphodiesterase (5'-nucleotidase family)
LNAVGCDYVCLGNHENDVGPDALIQRIHQSDFQWINSNLPNLKDKLQFDKLLDGGDGGDGGDGDGDPVPEHVLLNVGGINVALIGLMTEDPSLYRAGAFGGPTIRPVLE